MAVCLLFFSRVFAADGSSGCGPGWYVMQDNSIVSSALRAVTNTILFPISTLGMTFGTSNCTQHKLVLKEKESLHFATMNHFELKRDIAKGTGEYLSAFSNTLGCPNPAQSRLNHNLRARYPQIYNDSTVDPEQVLLEVYRTILSDKILTAQCSLSVG